jgi:hypothetical protein
MKVWLDTEGVVGASHVLIAERKASAAWQSFMVELPDEERSQKQQPHAIFMVLHPFLGGIRDLFPHQD